MTAITFDTLKFATRLEQAGVSAPQARAKADVMREVLGEVLTAQSDALNATHARDMHDTRTQAETAIARLESKVDVGFAELRKDITHLEQRVDARFTFLKWMLGLVLGGVVSLLAGITSLVVKTFF